MDLATKAAIDRLRKIAQHGPALMSVSREDAQRILAHMDDQTNTADWYRSKDQLRIVSTTNTIECVGHGPGR